MPCRGDTSGFDSQHVTLGNDLVQLQGSVTITDRDGDPASASQNLDLGGRIGFADDARASASAPAARSSAAW